MPPKKQTPVAPAASVLGPDSTEESIAQLKTEVAHLKTEVLQLKTKVGGLTERLDFVFDILRESGLLKNEDAKVEPAETTTEAAENKVVKTSSKAPIDVAAIFESAGKPTLKRFTKISEAYNKVILGGGTANVNMFKLFKDSFEEVRGAKGVWDKDHWDKLVLCFLKKIIVQERWGDAKLINEYQSVLVTEEYIGMIEELCVKLVDLSPDNVENFRAAIYSIVKKQLEDLRKEAKATRKSTQSTSTSQRDDQSGTSVIMAEAKAILVHKP